MSDQDEVELQPAIEVYGTNISNERTVLTVGYTLNADGANPKLNETLGTTFEYNLKSLITLGGSTVQPSLRNKDALEAEIRRLCEAALKATLASVEGPTRYGYSEIRPLKFNGVDDTKVATGTYLDAYFSEGGRRLLFQFECQDDDPHGNKSADVVTNTPEETVNPADEDQRGKPGQWMLVDFVGEKVTWTVV